MQCNRMCVNIPATLTQQNVSLSRHVSSPQVKQVFLSVIHQLPNTELMPLYNILVFSKRYIICASDVFFKPVGVFVMDQADKRNTW